MYYVIQLKTMAKDIAAFVKKVIKLSVEHETNHPLVLTVKAQEELGEFAEAMLYDHGLLRHKKIDTEPFGELADVFMVMLAAIVRTHMDNMSQEAMYHMLEVEFNRKLKKYLDLFGANDGREPKQSDKQNNG